MSAVRACARQLLVVLFCLQALSVPRAASRPYAVRGARKRSPGAGAWAGPWRGERTYHVLRTGLGLRGQERLRGGGSDSEEAGATTQARARSGANAYQWGNGRGKRGWAWEQGGGEAPFAPAPGTWGPEVERDCEAHEPGRGTQTGAFVDGAARAPSREVEMLLLETSEDDASDLLAEHIMAAERADAAKKSYFDRTHAGGRGEGVRGAGLDDSSSEFSSGEAGGEGAGEEEGTDSSVDSAITPEGAGEDAGGGGVRGAGRGAGGEEMIDAKIRELQNKVARLQASGRGGGVHSQSQWPSISTF
jgi:hypothetical protein